MKYDISQKDKVINKLRTERDKLKEQVQKFKGFWRKLIKHFQEKVGYDRNADYTHVSNDLYRNGIFDDNDKEIVNNYRKKVKTIDELNQSRDNPYSNNRRF